MLWKWKATRTWLYKVLILNIQFQLLLSLFFLSCLNESQICFSPLSWITTKTSGYLSIQNKNNTKTSSKCFVVVFSSWDWLVFLNEAPFCIQEMKIFRYSPSKDGDENTGGTQNWTILWANLIWLGTWSNFEGNEIANLQRALLISIILWVGDSGAGWINMLIAAHTKSSVNWPNS